MALTRDEERELAALLERMVGGESFADFVSRIAPSEPLPDHMRPIADVLDAARRRPMRVCLSVPPGHAKLCADSTPVLTPGGWSTHGDLRVGSEVYAPDGTITTVTHVTEKGLATLAVEFSDGEVIRVNPGHRWTVRDRARHKIRVVETGEMLEAGLSCGFDKKGRPRARWLVEFTKPLAGREATLPVEPYFLGLWLGDGATAASRITQSAADAAHSIAELERRGLTIGSSWIHSTTGCVTFSVLATDVTRFAAGKRIPDVYFTASEAQRRDLLRGLVDSDGHVGASGKVRFSNSNRGLIDDVVRLVATLGYRASVNYVPPPPPSGRKIEQKVDCWQVAWTPTDGVPQGLLPRRSRSHRAVRRDRSIVSITPCAPEPGHCITVDHPSHLYLVGDRLVPTHNTVTLLRGIAWWLTRSPADTCAYVTYSDAQARSKSRMARDWAQQAGVALHPDFTGLGEWRTRQGGGLLAAGSRGKLTGQRVAGLLVVDDPYKSRDEVQSEIIREAIYTRFREVAMTRLQGGSVIVLHCIAEGEPVLMGDGTWRSIEAVEPGAEVMALDGDAWRPRRVLDARLSGDDDTLRIAAEHGAHVRCNARHPLLTPAGWVKAGDLRVGDTVAAFDGQAGGLRVDPELAWFAGFMLGDGWVTSWKRKGGNTARCVCIANKKRAERSVRAVDYLEKLTGRRAKLTGAGYYRLDSVAAGAAMIGLGLSGDAWTKSIPAWVHALAPDLKVAFLRGYADADGHECARTTDSRIVASVNRPMIEAVALLARSAGIRHGRLMSSTQIVKAPNSKEPKESTIWKVMVNFAAPPQRWVKVTGIEPAGRARVYDLAVDGAANFVVRGLLVHNTRWSEDDLIGRLAREGWNVINLPAIAEANDALGRAPGEALWPERYPVRRCEGPCGHDGHLEQIRADVGAYSWAALYTGKPAPPEGGLFQRRWWSWFRLPEDNAAARPAHSSEAPAVVLERDKQGRLKLDWITISVDSTFGKTGVTADNVGLLVVGGRGMQRFVLEDVTAQRTFEETKQAIRALLTRWPARKVLIEDAANGDAVASDLRAALGRGDIRDQQGLPVIAAVELLRPVGGKFARANAMVGAVEAGLWHLREGSTWAERMADEFAVFPNGAHDDRVDAASQLAAHYGGTASTLKLTL